MPNSLLGKTLNNWFCARTDSAYGVPIESLPFKIRAFHNGDNLIVCPIRTDATGKPIFNDANEGPLFIIGTTERNKTLAFRIYHFNENRSAVLVEVGTPGWPDRQEFVLGEMAKEYRVLNSQDYVLEEISYSGSIRHNGYFIRGTTYVTSWNRHSVPAIRRMNGLKVFINNKVLGQTDTTVILASGNLVVNWSYLSPTPGKNDLFEESDYAEWLGMRIRPIFFPD